MKARKVITLLSVLGAIGAVGTSSESAEALSTTCTVTRVAWATGGSGTLQIYCGGSWRYAFGSSSSCPVANTNARRSWQSLAQAAMLSGKRLYMEYDNCTGGPGIKYVQLRD